MVLEYHGMAIPWYQLVPLVVVSLECLYISIVVCTRVYHLVRTKMVPYIWYDTSYGKLYHWYAIHVYHLVGTYTYNIISKTT